MTETRDGCRPTRSPTEEHKRQMHDVGLGKSKGLIQSLAAMRSAL